MSNLIFGVRCLVSTVIIASLLCGLIDVNPALAAGSNITGRTVGAGLASLVIWPGIGQAMNKNSSDKVAMHALGGLFPPFRLWSGYDALVNKTGGIELYTTESIVQGSWAGASISDLYSAWGAPTKSIDISNTDEAFAIYETHNEVYIPTCSNQPN